MPDPDPNDDERWGHMFSVQYDVCLEVDLILDKAMPRNKYPPIWRSMLDTYVIEHLAERARSNNILSPLPSLMEPNSENNPTESEQVQDG